VTCLRLLFTAFLLASFTFSLAAQNPPALLVSIDGLRPNYILEADAHGLKVPNLRRMLTEGAFSSGVHGVLPTVTYPSHTTLVTGVT
jgi:predicted AlkP superfamily pyrophosphatase or phosphodiesterase